MILDCIFSHKNKWLRVAGMLEEYDGECCFGGRLKYKFFTLPCFCDMCARRPWSIRVCAHAFVPSAPASRRYWCAKDRVRSGDSVRGLWLALLASPSQLPLGRFCWCAHFLRSGIRYTALYFSFPPVCTSLSCRISRSSKARSTTSQFTQSTQHAHKEPHNRHAHAISTICS